MKGELLWQGTAGFCVVTSAEGKNVRVLRLQGRRDESSLAARLTVPIISLLDASVVPITADFGQRPREVLRSFLRELAEGLGHGIRHGAFVS